MRVPTGIYCKKCGVEYNQDMSGNMHCACGVSYRWSHIAVGQGH